jgi:hypothetical protein
MTVVPFSKLSPNTITKVNMREFLRSQGIHRAEFSGADLVTDPEEKPVGKSLPFSFTHAINLASGHHLRSRLADHQIEIFAMTMNVAHPISTAPGSWPSFLPHPPGAYAARLLPALGCAM